MATESRRPDTPVIETLREHPERFDLVQAVRILERAAAGADEQAAASRRVGGDADPRDEAVRLRAELELAFPATEISGLEESGGRPALSVAAMGLIGPSGVLPTYYSEMVLAAQRGRNTAMRDFLDIFNHRAISLFVRSAEKYRIAMGFEYGANGAPDAISDALYAFVGLGQPSLRGRQAAPDTALAYYAGHYAHRPRTAGGLGQILSDFFQRSARIVQFRGSWGFLPPHEQTRLSSGDPAGSYSQLGMDTVCGSRVYDVQNGFRVCLGPLDYPQFEAFLPGATQMAQVIALTRSYVGPAMTFDVQLTLRASEIPPLTLSADPATGGRLGWNTWLPTRGPRDDADDAVFAGEEAA